MRLSTLPPRDLDQINKLTPLQPLDLNRPSHYEKRPQTFKPLCHEPSIDDLLMTDQIFDSEKNDIRPIFTGSKFLSLTEDLLHSHIKLCIHKNNTEENETLPTEVLKVEPELQETQEYQDQPWKAKEDSVKSGSPNGREDVEYKKPKAKVKVERERKGLLELLKKANLEQYIPMVDEGYPMEELYGVRGCDLETKLEEVFGYMKIGHRRRLGVLILEEREEFKRLGLLKLTESGLITREENGEDVKEDRRKMTKLPSLDVWLRSMKMEKYQENFIETGYENYEFIILLMCNEYLMLNDMRLKNDLGIAEYDDRNEILTRLYRDRYNIINVDFGTQITEGTELESSRDNMSCNKGCSIF